MFEIRPARISDAFALYQFAERTFWKTFAQYNAAEDMRAYMDQTYSEEKQCIEICSLEKRLEIAIENQKIVGYFQLSHARNTLELQRFYVDSQWHGRGVAPALMERALEVSRSLQYRVVQLGVWESNPRAIAFYKKQGFEVVASRPFVLGTDLQTDLVMQRIL